MIKEDVCAAAAQVAVINAALELHHHKQQTPALTNEVLQSLGVG